MSGVVLIIEDEGDLATTLEYNLRSEGFQVRLAHSGRQGLAAATSAPTPDVIVLALMLPDLAGTEICRRLREKPGDAGAYIETLRVVGYRFKGEPEEADA